MKNQVKQIVTAGVAGLMILGTAFTSYAGQWQQNSTGWWYQEDNGGYPVNQWKALNGKWYYFNQDGYMLTGWQNLGGAWYYLGTSGAMHTGWLQSGDTRYYMDEYGVMVTGDRRIAGKDYSFNADGSLNSDEQVDYAGRYVDGFTLAHGSDRGIRIEIEDVSDGRIWASIYMHDYNSSSTTIKGRLEGVKLENGIASGTYRRAWREVSDSGLKVLYETGTFQIKLKNPDEYTSFKFHEGMEWEAEAFSPMSFRYDNNKFEDAYLVKEEWEGELLHWFMESEDDLL